MPSTNERNAWQGSGGQLLVTNVCEVEGPRETHGKDAKPGSNLRKRLTKAQNLLGNRQALGKKAFAGNSTEMYGKQNKSRRPSGITNRKTESRTSSCATNSVLPLSLDPPRPDSEMRAQDPMESRTVRGGLRNNALDRRASAMKRSLPLCFVSQRTHRS